MTQIAEADRSSSIECSSCGNNLGRWLGPRECRIARITRHQREFVGLPISIKCEKCGAVWTAPIQDQGPMSGVETK